MRIEDNYKMLACAVIEQACRDVKRYPDDVRSFLCGDSPILGFVPRIDGKAIYEKAKENYKKYNCYISNIERNEQYV